MDALSLPVSIAIFIASGAIVWFCGTRLAVCADRIARTTNIGREFLGLLLLGGVTSLPELAVATTATLQGTPTLTINDVLGSAAINVVIRAIADASIGRNALTSVQGSPAVLLQGVVGILLMALVAAATVAGDTLVFGIGAWSWLMLAVYLFSLRLFSTSHAGRGWTPTTTPRDEAAETADGTPEQTRGRLIATTVGASAGILGAGFLLARTGSQIAGQTGLGTSFFGAVFLAVATSLPELSTVLAAVRLRQYAMAISDVFGTNLFNVTIIVLVDALHPGPPVLPGAGRFAGFAALQALALTAIFLVGMIERRDRTVLRMGVDSFVALILYTAGVVVLYRLR